MGMSPQTEFGYGIYLSNNEELSDHIFNNNMDVDEWCKEARQALAKEFECEVDFLDRLKDSPVQLINVYVGDEEEFALFISSTYASWDWDYNGRPINPEKFIIPDNTKEILERSIKAMDLNEELVQKASFFALNSNR